MGWSWLGNRIRSCRVRQELTQVELGNKVGLSETEIACIENEQREVSEDELFRIAAALDVRVEQLCPVGDRIYKLRRGTQWQLGVQVGLSQPTISLIERGERGVSKDELQSFAVALGVTVEQLRGEEPILEPHVPVPNVRHLQSLYRLTPDQAGFVDELIRLYIIRHEDQAQPLSSGISSGGLGIAIR